MKKILTTAAFASLSTSSYATPAVSVIDVKTEGVLCASGQFYEQWEEEDNSSIWG